MTTRELAAALGVSESSVKRWADDGSLRVSRTAGGHRRIEVQEAVRFIRKSGATVVLPHVLGLPGVVAAPDRSSDTHEDEEALFLWLRDGQGARVIGLLQALYLEGTSVAALVDGPIRGALERIGELWKRGDEGVFEEHQALDLLLQGLRRLAPLLPRPDEGAPVAMGGAVSDDPHLLPTLAASMVCTEAGYRAVNLGPDTPSAALVAGVGRLAPRLIWISASSPPRAGLSRYLRSLLEGIADDHLLVAGGRHLHDHDRIDDRRFVPLSTMAELAAFLDGLDASAAAGRSRVSG